MTMATRAKTKIETKEPKRKILENVEDLKLTWQKTWELERRTSGFLY
jgi:hypothetical protein